MSSMSLSGIARMNFQGQREFKNILNFFTENKYPFTIIENQKVERGNGSFIRLKVKGFMTACGKVDVVLFFFGEKLATIYLKKIPMDKDMNVCSKKELNRYKSGNADTQMSVDSKGRDIMYSDPAIINKMNEWIEKWS